MHPPTRLQEARGSAYMVRWGSSVQRRVEALAIPRRTNVFDTRPLSVVAPKSCHFFFCFFACEESVDEPVRVVRQQKVLVEKLHNIVAAHFLVLVFVCYVFFEKKMAGFRL